MSNKYERRDLTTRSMPLAPNTLDEDRRSIEAVMTTEGRVEVWDWKTWGVIEEVLRVDGVPLPEQIILLDTHQRWSVDDIRGSVREIRREGSSIVGRLFFSDDEKTEVAWQKARQGHLNAVSIGYRVIESETIQPNKSLVVQGTEYTAGALPLRVTTKWELRELSLVPIGADPSAKTRGLEMESQEMGTEREKTAPQAEEARAEAPEVKTVDLEAVRQEAAKAERQRQIDLRAMAGTDVPAEVVERAIADGLSKEEAAPMFLTALRNQRSAPVETRIEVGQHRPDDMIRVLGAALVLGCAGIQDGDERIRTEAAKYRGIGLRDLARLVLRAEGEEAPLSGRELAERALSSGTFTYLLDNTTGKTLKAVYAENPGTFVRWCSRRNVSDFKTHTDVSLSSFNTIEQVGKNGEISHGALAESTETFRAYTYGIQFAVGRTDIINDDLNGFTRAVRSLALACSRNIDDVAYALLTSNAGVGPTMTEDAKALFATNHAQANYSASAVAIDDTGLLTGKKLLAKIKGLPDGEGNSAFLNLYPRFLLCPTDLEDAALRAAQSRDRFAAGLASTSAASYNYSKNIHEGTFEVIREPRLDGATNGTTAWYLIADPAQAELLALVALDGDTEPHVESVTLQNVLGMGWRVYHDVGVFAADWRGAWRSKGA